jgi:hypothetical protein
MKIMNKAPAAQKQAPKANFEDVKKEHEENRSGKNQDRETRWPIFFPQFRGFSLVSADNEIEPEAVKNGDEDQHCPAQTQNCERNQVLTNFHQHCSLISSTSSCSQTASCGARLA